MKKCMLSLFLALLLLVTGCGPDTSQTGTKAALPLPDFLQGARFTKHLDISVGFWNIQELVDASESDAILRYIEDLFNITIKPVSLSWNNYAEQVSMMAATDTLPDVFISVLLTSSSSSDYSKLEQLVADDIIRPLPKAMDKFPKIQAILDNFEALRYTDGYFYCLPRMSFTDSILGASDAAMLVRKDWMEALGFTQPESIDDFINMVCAFASQDPDGNGVDDTIGYNVNSLAALGKWLILGIAPECNVYSYTQTKDGLVIPSYLTADFENVIQVFSELYQRGGLDPDFYTKKAGDALNDFCNGRLGALEHKSSPGVLAEIESLWNLSNDKPFADCVGVLNIFPAPDGVRYSNSSSSAWSETYFSSHVSDEKMERILYLFEYLLSDEGLSLTSYGFENVDYGFDGENYTSLIDLNGNSFSKALEKKYPSLTMLRSLAAWGGGWSDFEDNNLNRLRYGEYVIQLANGTMDWFVDNTVLVQRPFDFYLMPKDIEPVFTGEEALDAMVHIIIGQTDDPVQAWRDTVDSYERMGLWDYILDVNAQYADYIRQ